MTQRLLRTALAAAAGVFALAGPALAGPEDELLAADRAFAARADAAGGGTAFVEFAHEDARMFPFGGPTVKGSAAIAEEVDTWGEDLVIAWTPEEAVAAASGDFGYTWGYADITDVDAAGAERRSRSKYVTVWMKDGEGAWKWIADIGNPAPALEAAAK